MITVELPWPPKELSPNHRGHWVPISKAKSRYRTAARLLARSALSKADGFSQFKAVRLAYEFYPPQARAYDRDNLAARMKAATDGIADAIGMNDRGFHFAPAEIREKVKGGMVRVTIEQVTL
ncbi:endonuclease [Achromobacter xylosoxidans]|uniref:endonuclease n=1 Tax=Alcaligenes xylosoxydans xylosoxydans TaxID=85698 RepID=UPI0005F99F52|nr:endonuclease [Achromobacter xylosoxidans]